MPGKIVQYHVYASGHTDVQIMSTGKADMHLHTGGNRCAAEVVKEVDHASDIGFLAFVERIDMAGQLHWS